MAVVKGVGGSVKIGTTKVAEIKEWSLNLEADTLEPGGFEKPWREYVSGLKSWSGSFNGNWDMTDTTGQKALQDAYLNGTTVALQLNVDGTHYYSGSAIIKSISVSVSYDGLAEVTFDYQGTGSLTYT